MNFPTLLNDRILKAARGEIVDKVPIWIMRQAGRYLPEFRELRTKHDFFTICQTPSLAAEVTLLPIKRYDLDAAIIFSDILVIPQALGLVVEMKSGVGPVLPDPLKIPADIKRLKRHVNVKESLSYVFEAITLTRNLLNGKVPLIGFSGAPWTLMCYMIEGGGSKTMSEAKKWLYKYPAESEELLKILTDVTIEYLVSQVEAGAQMLQVFESNAEYLNLQMFSKFAYPSIAEISMGVKRKLKELSLSPVPMVIFSRGAHYAKLAHAGYDVISIDWTVSPIDARNKIGDDITLQGNLDPCALYASNEQLKNYAEKMLVGFGKHRYIANLGHGIYPDVEPEKVKILIDTVRGF